MAEEKHSVILSGLIRLSLTLSSPSFCLAIKVCFPGLSALPFFWSRALLYLLSPVSNCYMIFPPWKPSSQASPTLNLPQFLNPHNVLDIPHIPQPILANTLAFIFNIYPDITTSTAYSYHHRPSQLSLSTGSLQQPPNFVLILPLSPHFGLFNTVDIMTPIKKTSLSFRILCVSNLLPL